VDQKKYKNVMDIIYRWSLMVLLLSDAFKI
jgi:hypothetical protein